jgi:uncharacterized protein (TIGR02300 family)
MAVAKPELGTKRICASCGAKFYDLSRDPIVCPKCGTVYEVAAMPARATAAAAAAKPAPAAAAEEAEPVQPAGAEVISLEEAAEAENKAATGKSAPEAEGEEDVEIADDSSEDDTTFLEQDEEESSDVSDLIGEGIEEKEEEN